MPLAFTQEDFLVVFVISLLPLNPSEQVRFRRKVSLALKARFRHWEQMDAG